MADEDDNNNKRRRQNVACDSCKFRRVKCDLSDLLQRPDIASSSGGTAGEPTLSDLVRANPGVDCSKCSAKGLKCTKDQIINPSKPNKGGRRIDEARRRFGAGEAEAGRGPEGLLGEETGQRENTDVNRAVDAEGVNNDDGIGYPLDPPQDQSTVGDVVTQSASTLPANPAPWGGIPLTGLPVSNDVAPVVVDSDFQAFLDSLNQPPTSSEVIPSYHDVPLFTASYSPYDILTDKVNTSTSQTELQAKAVWRWNDQQHGAAIAARAVSVEPTENQFAASFLPPHRQSWSLEATSTPRTSSSSISGTPVSSSWAQSNSATSNLDDSSSIVGRKRQRTNEDVSDGNDWRLWSEACDQMVRWGRRERVQERLADRALGQELSKHLVKTFFHCVHPSFPALSPESFYIDWHRADQISERMSPAQEALCAVMEAWGARYSDSAVILGLGPDLAKNAPKVIQKDGTLIPGSQARTHWGRSRTTACNALVERARKLIDGNGLMRSPSVTGVQAMLLYNQLLHISDQKDLATAQWMENQMLQAMTVEQMKMLNLMWDAPGEIPSDTPEMPSPQAQMRMKQRRIFWTVVVSDAFSAATAGEEPRIPDSQLEAAAEWLTEVSAKLPPSTFKTLAFFMQCYHRFATIGRIIAKKMAIPSKRPGTIRVPEFCTAVRQCWSMLDTLASEILTVTSDLLNSCEHTLLGFSPMNYITNLRLSTPFMLLIIHQWITEQLTFRRTLTSSFIVDDASSSGSPPSPQNPDLAMLEGLNMQSIDVTLHACRSQIDLFKVLLPTGMVQSAVIFLRVQISAALFLSEVPTNEQGYPADSRGGMGWTWEAKQSEIKVCVDALYQMGWAWADVGETLNSIMVTMERMEPTLDQLAAYASQPKSRNVRVESAKIQEEMQQATLLKQAMVFWPPKSVPTMIESAMRDLQISPDRPVQQLDLTSSAVPWRELDEVNAARSSRLVSQQHSQSGLPGDVIDAWQKAGAGAGETSGQTQNKSHALNRALDRMGVPDFDLARAGHTTWPTPTTQTPSDEHIAWGAHGSVPDPSLWPTETANAAMVNPPDWTSGPSDTWNEAQFDWTPDTSDGPPASKRPNTAAGAPFVPGEGLDEMDLEVLLRDIENGAFGSFNGST